MRIGLARTGSVARTASVSVVRPEGWEDFLACGWRKVSGQGDFKLGVEWLVRALAAGFGKGGPSSTLFTDETTRDERRLRIA